MNQFKNLFSEKIHVFNVYKIELNSVSKLFDKIRVILFKSLIE
jgi:hypothetical protein